MIYYNTRAMSMDYERKFGGKAIWDRGGNRGDKSWTH